MSDKPIAERLQVKGDRKLAVLGASAGLDKTIGAKDRRCGLSEADVVLVFTPNHAALARELPPLLKSATADAIIWVAYPKLKSALASDLSRDIIHKLAPDYGLDTVAQIAIDDDWSALRLKRV
jgi:hypothetical protein